MEEKNIFEKAKDFVKTGFEKVKTGAKVVGDAAMEVLSENPILLIPVISAVTAVLGGGIKKLQEHNEDRIEACKVPNVLTGVDYQLKHPMTNEENQEYENRLIGGQNPGRALDEMGLLK